MKYYLLALALLVSSASALYEADSPVVQLTKDNFQSLVVDSDAPWLVEFYAPWCGHCKKLAPEYEKAAKALKGIFNIGAVDMTTQKEAGAPYGIKGYPTVKFFGADKKNPTDYSGARTADGITSFMLKQATAIVDERMGKKKETNTAATQEKDVVVLTDDSFDANVFNGKDAWLVKFYAPWCGHCKKMAPAWDEAATKLKGTKGIKIAKVDATENGALASRFGVKGYPTVKYFAAGTDKKAEPVDYSSGRDVDSIVKYVEEKLSGKTKPVVTEAIMEKDVVVLGEGSFDSNVFNGKDAWLVKFYAPWCGHCKKMAPAWDEAATKLKDTKGIKIAKVDATENGALASRFGVKGYPTVKFFAAGTDKKAEPTDYSSGRDVDSIVKFCEEKVGAENKKEDL